jgi:hypothetical protein
VRSRLATRVGGFLALVLACTAATGLIGTPASAATPPPSAPVLVGPIGTSVDSNPVLQWHASTGAVKYRVQVATSASFSPVFFTTDTTGLHATPDKDLPVGTLYWHVAASSDGSTFGSFSDTAQFTRTWTDAPVLTAPGDTPSVGFPDTPAVFSWNPLAGASTYTIQFAKSDEFPSESTTSYTTPNTSFTLTDPQTVDQAFFWRVQGTSSSGSVSAWSEIRSYTQSWDSTPTLQAPTNGANTTDITFQWSPVPGAQKYELQVSPNGDWANNVTTDDQSIVGTSYTPTTPYANGSYFWRVRAHDADGNWGSWSDVWEFGRQWLNRPTILTPSWDPAAGSPTQVTGDLELSWTPVPHAAYYEFQVSTDPNFSSSTNCYTNHTDWSPYLQKTGSATLPGTCALDSMTWDTGTTYYWRVRGIDDSRGLPTSPGVIVGLWSNSGGGAAQFIRNPTAPTYVTPADGASVVTPTMSWTSVVGAQDYRLTVVKHNGSTISGYPITTYATSYTPPSTTTLQQADGPFSWYVQAVDAFGVVSAIPANPPTFSIANNSGGPTGTIPVLDSPADGASFAAMPQMSWEPMTGAAKYTVHIAQNGFEKTPLVANDMYTTYTSTTLPLAPGTYTWWVEGVDSTGISLGESADRTLTITAPPILGSGDYLAPDRCSAVSSCTAVPDTPTLRWNPQANVGEYVVTIATDPNFTNVLKTYVTPYSSFTPRDSLLDSQAGQAYYWFVRSCSDAWVNSTQPSRCGPGSDDTDVNGNASAFRKVSNPVQLTSPSNNATVSGTVHFQWADYLDSAGSGGESTQEAKQYFIQISTAHDFSSILDSATVDTPSYTAEDETYPDGPIYWRVQAIDASTNHLTWSDAWLVTKQSVAPHLTYPSSGHTQSGVPYLAWDPASGAAKYTVEVYRNGDLSFNHSNLVISKTTLFTAFSPTAGLAAGDYAWRVQPTDGFGRQGQWSAGRVFHLSLSAPGLTAPADNLLTNSGDILFSWSPVVGAVQYQWQLSHSADFGVLVAHDNTVMTSYAPPSVADGTYRWRVEALDGSGNTLAVSDSRSLSKDSVAPTVTAMTPAGAPTITQQFGLTFSKPVTGLSQSSFKVTITGTSTVVPGKVVAPTATSATWTPTSALIPGEYYTVAVTSAIHDAAGNKLAPRTWPVRTSGNVENDSPALVERWDHDTAAKASGHGQDASDTAGATASMSFSGTSVAILGTKQPTGGNAAVYLDGKKQSSTASFYGAATKYQAAVWSKSGLSAGRHTITLKVLGTKPAHAKGSWVYFDAFKVGTVVTQENSTHVTEAFHRVTSSVSSGGSYDSVSHVSKGDTATRPYFQTKFRGTHVSVYGTKSLTSGKAAIYVDNAKKATVNLNGPSAFRAVVWTSPTLSDKLHTVRIEVVGTSSGKKSDVGIDYVAVS